MHRHLARSLVILAGIAFSLGLACVSARASDFYVSPSGRNTNPGTSPDRPWKSLAKVNKRRFSPGDRILLEGGQTFRGGIVIGPKQAGTADQPVILSSYGTGRATIESGAVAGVTVSNTGGVEVSHLVVVGAGRTANTANGVWIVTTRTDGSLLDHVVVDDVDVRGYGQAGVAVDASGTSRSGFSSVRLTNIVSHDNADAGILSNGFFDPAATGFSHHDITVAYCKAYDNPGIPGKKNHTGDGIVLGGVDGVMIERCLAWNNGALNDYTGGGPAGIWVWDSNNAVIQFNESHHNRTMTLDGDGFDLDGGVTNSRMQFNYSHDNDGAGYLLAEFPGARPFFGNVVCYNVSENDGRRVLGGIAAWNGGGILRDTEVFNNTIFLRPSETSTPKAVVLQTTIENVNFRNNIFVVTGGLPLVESQAPQTTVAFQSNLYWTAGAPFSIVWAKSTYASLDSWRADGRQETIDGTAVGRFADPGLVAAGAGGTLGDADRLRTLSAYALTVSSPAVDSGIDIAARFNVGVGKRDFFGTSLPQGPAFDIGADERPREP